MRTREATSTSARLLPCPRLLLVALFVGAIAIRLYHVNEPPLNFHATRQYRSLLIARALYYDALGSASPSQAEIARINRERQGTLEPPILETLVATGYRLVGGEQFWVPRVLSSTFWLIGGIFLYLIARRLVPGRDAAVVALAFYLFSPFSVVASRSFQPDALMVALLLASVWAFARARENPAPTRVTLAAALGAGAVLVKPVSIFVLAAVLGGLTLTQRGLRPVVSGWAPGVLAVAVLPTALFYGHGMLVSGTLQQQAQASWLPALIVDRFFWKGWLSYVDNVIGLPVVVIALVGVLIAAPGVPRRVLAGLWIGYAAFCAVFSYHIATHDYYHLQLVPIVALSVAPVAAVLIERLIERHPTQAGLRAAALGIMALALMTSALATRARLVTRSGLENRPRIAAEIGRHVGHSTNTIYLSSDYGLPLEFHGEFAGRPWPLVSDLEWERLAGVTPLDAERRYSRDFAAYSADYFVVADPKELERQVDLKQFLTARFRTVAGNEHYAIFDLRP